MLAEPGDVLLDKYRVEEVVGVGGMGRVVRAKHLFLDQPVAIKILLPAHVESKSTVERFLREAQATVRLRNEHIARVMDVGTLTDGAPFMVMEYLDGFNLNQILRHHGPQQPGPVVDLMLQACEGISEAHAMGIVHRDIKPSNFFLTTRPDGTNLLKILDFGISKAPVGVSELTNSQTVIGTPTYMAPEQMRTARSTDPRSDIWSIGVVMYQMLAGRRPFEAETYAELVLKVGIDPPQPLAGLQLPPGLEHIILRCLEKNPGARIPNVGELARLLVPYATDAVAARQSAERAGRILVTPRNSLTLAAMTVGNSTPSGANSMNGANTSPSATSAAITSPSWQDTSAATAQGQVGAQSRAATRRKHVVVGSVIAMCVGAGVAGFFAASALSKTPASASAAGIAPAAAPLAPAQRIEVTPLPASPPTPTPPAVVEIPPPKPPATATVAAKPFAPAPTIVTPLKAAAATPAPTPPTPSTKAATVAHTPAKPITKTAAPAAATDDLFDTRH